MLAITLSIYTDVFADEIEGPFPKTAALLSIVTPRYLKSATRRDLTGFCLNRG